MALNESAVPDSILPVDVNTLLLDGIRADSLVIRSGVRVITTNNASLAVPRLSALPTAVWAAEGASLLTNDPVLAEGVTTPSKVGGVIVVSRELAEDSTPDAVDLVGRALSESLSRAIDSAFFVGTGVGAIPAGLGTVTPGVTIAAAPIGLDPLVSAVVNMAALRGQARAFYMNHLTYLRLAAVRQGTGSNVSLVNTDASAGLNFNLLGLPVFISEDVPANVVYVLDTQRTLVVMRSQITVEKDKSVRFTTDEVAVKATARVGFNFSDTNGVAKVTFAA